jgi:hypothetical protein
MEFKINTRIRVKITVNKLLELKNETNYDYFYEFFSEFCKNSGLKRTSTQWKNGKRVYYFQILDKHKYFLAKINYGI